MKYRGLKNKIFSTLPLLMFCSIQMNAQFNYTSPIPNSINHNPETNIIFKLNKRINPQSLAPNLFSILGSTSGKHYFSIKLTEDSRTIILKPITPFLFGESVNVSIAKGVKCEDLTFLSSYTLMFKIIEQALVSNLNENSAVTNVKIDSYKSYPNFPSITVSVNDNPSDGKIFFYNISALASSNDRYLSIINNDGTPIYARQENNRGPGFTLQKNGYLTYWNNKNFYMLDSAYVIVDSFACGNGYTADWHELQVLENKHVFLVAWDLQMVDMRPIVTGGQQYATVQGLVIQELDENKDVVFQWRSWDHFNITDAIGVDFTQSVINYVHGNAIDIDSDTSLLLSSRLMNEITKINRKTGEIIWRLGGKNNQFTFIDDDQGFCHQHDVRRLSNGNITLFDNGTCHEPKISSAKEYELDEVNKTAKLVWKYTHTSNLYCETMGNVQRLPNGNTFINWGTIPTSTPSYSSFTEVRPDKSTAYELRFNTFNLVYRSYRFPWNINSTSIQNPNNITSFEISAYPNPANDYFNLNIFLKNPVILNILLLNTNGMIVSNINNYKAIEGSNTIRFDTKGIESGIYFCAINSLEFNASKKVVIIK